MVTLTGENAAERLNRLAREQLKHKMLADINVDLVVCEIEGWDQREFLHELHEEIEGLCKCR